jgi:predicted metal-dependent HD superfamily phosphohydrolase
MELLNRKAYPAVCLQILEELEERLPKHLTYHTVGHTLDVANICNHYIDYYMVADSVAELIRIAAIGHDYGYIYGPREHEEKSITELQPKLQGTYSKKQIEVINGMIRATKVPQRPQNIYEEILADADLDYLGRPDYYKLSSGLYTEFEHFGVVSNEREWLEVQIKFLEAHHYHTDWAIRERVAGKKQVLSELREKARKLASSH